MVSDAPASLGCPACQAPAGHKCRRRDGRTRPPHADRVALAAARPILTWIAERFLTADVFGNLLLLIETEHTLGPHRAARRAHPFHDLSADDPVTYDQAGVLPHVSSVCVCRSAGFAPHRPARGPPTVRSNRRRLARFQTCHFLPD
ncbi:zinc finger domain-containing protein [Herbidospora yilanensis]|uniref:zinc finger domain-containing protein n=1 Tax=Herbidospora yilanensis TaxID=354426 RepID=UPI003F7079FC